MKTHKSLFIVLLGAVLIVACSQCQIDTDTSKDVKSYHKIGPAVTTANGLLMVGYPNGLNRPISGEEYKTLLEKEHSTLYERIEPYTVMVEPVRQLFVVKVYDGDKLILIDASCTEDRIDCWVLENQCTPESFSVPCLNQE